MVLEAKVKRLRELEEENVSDFDSEERKWDILSSYLSHFLTLPNERGVANLI